MLSFENSSLSMRLLIVDDELPNAALLEAVLEDAGYRNVLAVTDSRRVMPIVEEWQPDLILLDLMMPHFDGFDILQQLETVRRDTFLPVLVLTADAQIETRRRSLAAGASDFLSKPFDTAEVALRIENLLRARHGHVQLQEHNRNLDEAVRSRTLQLEKAQELLIDHLGQLEASQSEMLARLAQAGEFRDDDTGQHTYRVGKMSGLLARCMGLSLDWVDLIERAAPLHDLGKIGVSDSILLKSSLLSAEEFDVMKNHTIIGAALLDRGNSLMVQVAHRIARWHHERWDGTGYPDRRKGNEIPIEAQIVAVADVFDALTHDRPYKKAWTPGQALQEIRNGRGTQFSPRVVDAFLELGDVADFMK